MSIQKKLITIFLLVGCGTAVVECWLLWSAYSLSNKAQYVVPALNYLENVAIISTSISNQSRVASSFIVSGADVDREEFDLFSTRAGIALHDCKQVIMKQKLLNVQGEDEDLSSLISLENNYTGWKNETRALIDPKSGVKGVHLPGRHLKIPEDSAILEIIDDLLEDGIEEVHTAYHNLLISMGGVPWLIMDRSEKMEYAHAAIDYFVAVIKTENNLNKQLKETMSYLLTGEAGHLGRITRYGIQTEDSLAKWSESLDRKKEFNKMGSYEETSLLKSVSDNYAQVQTLIDLIIENKQSGKNREAITIAKNNLQILLVNRLLPAVSLAKADCKKDIDDVSNQLVSIAKSTVWQSLAAVLCVVLLIAVLVIRLMKMLSGSIKQIQTGIEEIGSGNLDNRLNPRTNDELGSLAASLNTMSECLQKSHNENASLNARLKQQVEELERANRDIEAFGYMVSHDMRNPLSAISCYTELLMENTSYSPDSQSSFYLQRIRFASHRLNRLIDDILLLSRVGHSEIIMEEIDISRIAHEIMDELIQREPDRKIDFTCQSDIIVKGSPQLITILLENILGNACKYSSTREQSVIVLGQYRENGETVCYVRDNGVGFDSGDAHKIFKAFERLHAEQEFKGNGIGLAIAHKIVSCHNGRIWAESTSAEGSVFYFTLASA